MDLLLKRRMLIEESDLALKLRLDGREGKDFRLFFNHLFESKNNLNNRMYGLLVFLLDEQTIDPVQ
ncbi:hypothetical protein OH685_09600 [Acinetobacter pittii]|nr:hypothetical protein OH685_09600 [Acinetobacter pittii]